MMMMTTQHSCMVFLVVYCCHILFCCAVGKGTQGAATTSTDLYVNATLILKQNINVLRVILDFNMYIALVSPVTIC